MALEVLASVSMWRSAMRDADRAWLRALLVGNLIFIPIGIAMLAVLPETPLRLVVGCALLFTAAGLRIASHHSFASTAGLRATAGTASGLLNGVAASGGVAAAMLMAAAHVPPAKLRATMVSFLLYAGVYVLVCAALMPTGKAGGLVSYETLRWAALLAPTMLAGIWLGKHSFANTDPAGYRQHVLTLLIVISALGVARAGFDLVTG
jgi:uncharacterized membrane protein YfcA